MKSVLNVGGSSKAIAIPPYYAGWKHDLLDIDPRGGADLVMDARELTRLPAGSYDAVYCSHSLEHFTRSDGAKVLRGFAHVLKNDGFAEIRVPDLMLVIQRVAHSGLDLDDTLYVSEAGPVSAREVFYGFGRQVEDQGNEYFLHKTGFSPQSLSKFVTDQGFSAYVSTLPPTFEVLAFLFKQPPTIELWEMLNLDRGKFPRAGLSSTQM